VSADTWDQSILGAHHDGPFLGSGQTNQRMQQKGNDHMSEKTKQKLDAIIQAKKDRERFFIGGPGFLQTFAGKGGQDDDPGDDDPGDDDPGDDDPGDDDPGDDDPGNDPGDDLDFEYTRGSIDQIMTANKLDFNQLLKDNPELKKAYTARFNKNMSARLKKYEGVDIDEYNDLKSRADSGKLEGDAKTWKDKHDALLIQIDQTSQQTAIQQVAIDNGLDAEQITFVRSMIKTSALEKDDEGEWMGIEDEIDRIKEKFPRMFDVKSDDKDDDPSDKKKGGKYNPGKKKHNQDSKITDAKERGRQRALERHNKK
jgi:hypothetical protein